MEKDPILDEASEQGHQLKDKAEREQALAIWLELKHGKPNAHAHLKAAPEHIREAVLLALVDAIEKKQTIDNPFE